MTIGIMFMKKGLLSLYFASRKKKVTGAYTKKNDGLMKIFKSIKPPMTMTSLFGIGMFEIRILYCFQNSSSENGNKKIVVELCHIFGTTLPR